VTLLHFEYRPGNNRSVHYSATTDSGEQIGGELEQAKARLVLVLAQERAHDGDLEKDKQGWRSYDQLRELIRLHRGYRPVKESITQMLAKTVAAVKKAAEELDLAIPRIIERYDGAARLADSVVVQSDESLVRQLLNGLSADDSRLRFPFSVTEIFDRRGLSRAEREIVWSEIAASMKQQVGKRRGPFYEVLKDLI